MSGSLIARLPFTACLTFCFISCSCNETVSEGRERAPSAFYVSSVNGDDLNNGLSAESSWKTLSRANAEKLQPGDSLRFERGSGFSGSLIINYSGTAGSMIVVTDYGSAQSPPPSFTNSEFNTQKNIFGNCVRLKGNYILVENLYCHGTVAELPSSAGGFTIMWELGAIYIDKTATNCIVRNNEIFDCGVGIKSYGEHALIQNNYIHDCNRILKEWSWGPIGIWLGADFQEVCGNRIFNYSVVDPRITWGPDSYGGGADGGAIEIDDARVPKSNISLHHNYSRDCQGFLEVSWTDVLQNPAYTDFRIHHNVSDDYQQFTALWRGSGFKIENNTIIRRKRNVNDWGVFNITQKNAQNMIRNNIVVVENDIVIFNTGKNGTATPESIIENNIFYAASGTLIIGKEGPGLSSIIADPRFVNYNSAEKAEDFSIASDSPARNKGIDLYYKEDFVLSPIPNEGLPDIGAFEFKQ
ncbi:MAG TPA: hypothetical protein VK155_10925 [Bacteroidales bacterium]|nr:hypothetical protein [Bacteroidales bacterium]